MLKTINAIYNLNRCLVSDDQDRALVYLAKQADSKHTKVYEFASGEKVLTWTIPQRWAVKNVSLAQGAKKIEVRAVTGSLPFTGHASFAELKKHLFFRKDYPQAIPYIMRFYEPKIWGICLAYNEYKKLNQKQKLDVQIESSWSKGTLKVLELTIPGKTPEEIHILAHVDHPHQANDNLSGVAVVLEIYQKLRNTRPTHTLKFIFHSETIGTIAYLAKRQKDWPKIKAALVLDIVGNKGSFLYQKTFSGITTLDLVTDYVFKKNFKKFRTYDFQELMGSEELTYNDPEIGIPGVLISSFPYKEYHTNFDTPEIIDEKQLEKAEQTILDIIQLLDQDFIPKRNFSGPLQRGPLGWFLNSMVENTKLDLFQYHIDGKRSALEIAISIGLDPHQTLKFSYDLKKRGLLK